MRSDKWYDYYKGKVEEVREKNPGCVIMTKEKYWRFDISAYWLNKFYTDYLFSLEQESMDRCMDCAKLRKQYETWDFWWMSHYCLPCAIKHMTIHWYKRILYFIKHKLCGLRKQKKCS